MQVSDTVTVVTISGEYVGGTLNHSKMQLWFLKTTNGCLNRKGMGFAHGVVTVKRIPKKYLNVVYVIPTNEQVCNMG